jgi:hypothetical protein
MVTTTAMVMARFLRSPDQVSRRECRMLKVLLSYAVP